MSGPRAHQHCNENPSGWVIDPMPLGLHNTARSDMSSLKVPAGYRVTLYEGKNGSGRKRVINGPANIPCFRDVNFDGYPHSRKDNGVGNMNDVIRSYRVENTVRTTLAPTTSAAPTTPPKDILQQSLNTIKQVYDAKAQEYKVVKDAEIEALRDNNAQQVTFLQNKQRQLIMELQTLKTRYDKEASELANVRTQFLQNIETLRQRNVEIKQLRDQIAEIESNMTATPKPVEPPGTADDSFGPSIYIIIDANAWNESGTLRALTSRNGAIVSEPFRFKDLYQTWVSSTRGKLRSLGGSGEFIGASEGCLVPRGMAQTSSTWTFKRIPDDHLHFIVVSNECGRRLEQGVADTVVLTTSAESQDGWYVVPIGSMM